MSRGQLHGGYRISRSFIVVLASALCACFFGCGDKDLSSTAGQSVDRIAKQGATASERRKIENADDHLARDVTEAERLDRNSRHVSNGGQPALRVVRVRNYRDKPEQGYKEVASKISQLTEQHRQPK